MAVRELIINADKTATLPSRVCFGDTLLIKMPDTPAGDYSDVLNNKAVSNVYIYCAVSMGTGISFANRDLYFRGTAPITPSIVLNPYVWHNHNLHDTIVKMLTDDITTLDMEVYIRLHYTAGGTASITYTVPFCVYDEQGNTNVPPMYLVSQTRKSNNPVYGNTKYAVPGAVDTFVVARPKWTTATVTSAEFIISTSPITSSGVHMTSVMLNATQLAALNSGQNVPIDYTYTTEDISTNDKTWVTVRYVLTGDTEQQYLACTYFDLDTFIVVAGELKQAGLGNAAPVGSTNPTSSYFGVEGNNINVFFTVAGYAPELADGTKPAAGQYKLMKSTDGGTTWTAVYTGEKSGKSLFKYTYTEPTDGSAETKIKLVCTDYTSGSVTESDVVTLATIKKIIMDVYKTGTGVAFGKVAEYANRFEVDASMPVYINGDLYLNGVAISRVSIKKWLRNQTSGVWTYDKIVFSNGIVIIQAYRVIASNTAAQTVWTPIDTNFTDPFVLSKVLVSTCGVDNASRTGYVGTIKFGNNNWCLRKYCKTAEQAEYLIKLVKVGIE